MSRVLITGITGFVGTHLARDLAANGFTIIGHSRKVDTSGVPSATNFIDNISPAAITENGIDCVVHLAGIAHDLANRFSADDYHQVNFRNTAAVYDAFAASAATTFIFVSSIKAAAEETSTPVDEEQAPSPESAYGRSKLLAEQHILHAIVPPGKHVYIFRPVMIHGPGNKGNLNQLYKFVRAGVPYPLGKFDNRRSFLSITNFCFIVRDFLSGRHADGVYHLSDEGSLSTRELVGMMSETIDRKPRIWNVSPVLVRLFAYTGSLLRLPFNRASLRKLTENLVVSNAKVLRALDKPLPQDIRTGMQITIRSFHD